MNATNFAIPTGERTAIVTLDRSFSFDDLHQLRRYFRVALAKRCPQPPRRILGCLEDNVDALFALLFVTEVTDYMPINPALPDAETDALLQSSGADFALVSRAFVATKSPQAWPVPFVVWDDVVAEALTALCAQADQGNAPTWATTGRLILHTSGSTGTPKRVPILPAAMNASARNIATGHALSDDDHALNALPTFHIGALVDVMLAPFAAGGSISITDQRAPAGLVQALIEQRPTWLQVVPTLLRRLVEDIAPETLREAGRSLRFVRSISAPVPPDLKRQVEDLFGCPVIEMYGMTETAGQIATVSREPKDFQPGSVGQPVGVHVAIMDRYGNRLQTGQTGEVCVNGPTVFEGYEGTNKEDVFFEDWFRTGDLGRLDQDGTLFLQGRLKEMVNVGGEKVSPHEVEVAALLMPDVIEAAAYAIPHPSLGEQVGLTVAARGHVAAGTVKAFLEGQLAAFKCPNSILVVDQLPRLANAKVDRLLLKRTAQDMWHARQSTALVSQAKHQTPQARTVAQHWVRILKCRQPEGADDFFDMGGDSLSATQLLLSLEKALGRDISPNQLFEAPTFAGLVAALSQEETVRPARRPRPVRYIQEKTVGWPGQAIADNGLLRSLGSLKSGHPLFWASQAHFEIDAILETLGAKRPIYVTGSLRHFKNRTTQDFETVAAQLADEIMAVQPNGPIALGGFCGGAWIMHYTADVLQMRGREVRVFVSFDYWPKRAMTYPVVHCMSNCEINAGRVHFAHHRLAQDLLHRGGVLALDVDSKHQFKAPDIAPHQAMLNAVLDGHESVPPAAPIDLGKWSLDTRMQVPQAQIRLTGRPRFYAAGGNASFDVTVTNTSSKTWDPTDISGLSVQVDLINLDGYMRKANVAFGGFDVPVRAGGQVAFTFDVTFPNKRVPMWLSCNLVSQGLTHFRSRAAGGYRSMILPNPFRARRLTAAE